jgi:hypothetical protein
VILKMIMPDLHGTLCNVEGVRRLVEPTVRLTRMQSGTPGLAVAQTDPSHDAGIVRELCRINEQQ